MTSTRQEWWQGRKTVVYLSPLGVSLVLGLSGNVTWPARNVTYGYIEHSLRGAPPADARPHEPRTLPRLGRGLGGAPERLRLAALVPPNRVTACIANIATRGLRAHGGYGDPMRIAAVKSGTFGSSIVKIFNNGTSTMGTILQVSNNNI